MDQPPRKRQRASKAVSDPAEESVTAAPRSPKTAEKRPGATKMAPALPVSLLDSIVYEESSLRETAGSPQAGGQATGLAMGLAGGPTSGLWQMPSERRRSERPPLGRI